MEVRRATLADLPYMDSLQSKNTKCLGFLTFSALEAFVVCEQVFIGFENDEPAGYVLGRKAHPGNMRKSQIAQACVQYDLRHRALGAALVEAFVADVQETVDHCILWCAQDLEANCFWEASGFEALAWRLGKRELGRLHLLWHRTLGPAGTISSYERPTSTTFGMMRQNRTVVGLQPGESWRDVKPEHRPDMVLDAWGPVKDKAPRAKKPKGPPVILIPMMMSGRVVMRPQKLFDGRGQMVG